MDINANMAPQVLRGKLALVTGAGQGNGRAIAMGLAKAGARVIVTEIDPTRALEAVMEGFRVLPIADAAREGDLFLTVTGDIHVIDTAHFAVVPKDERDAMHPSDAAQRVRNRPPREAHVKSGVISSAPAAV